MTIRCRGDRLTIYLDKLLIAAAASIDVSFEELVDHVMTTHKLLKEITTEQIINMEDEHDDTDDI